MPGGNSRPRPPALEAGAAAWAGEVRFRRQPRGVRASAQRLTRSERESGRNRLPSAVRPEVTYLDVSLSFRIAAWPDDRI